MNDIVKSKLGKRSIKEAIIETVVFFNMFDYPVTVYELWCYASINCEIADLKNAALELVNAKILETENGMYFLAGRKGLYDARQARFNFTERKFKRVRLVTKIFCFIPWIKLVAIGNLMGANNLKDNSDIDIFIITEAKRIWLSRFFCVAIVKFLGMRPKINNARDKICLSFFVSEAALDLRDLMLDGSNLGKDIYFYYWLAGLMPVYDEGNSYIKLIQENKWLEQYFPNWQPAILSKRRTVRAGKSRFYRDLVDLFVGGLESNVKKYQKRIMPESLRAIKNKDTRVVVNDQVLKLHVEDRRGAYRKKYFEKLRDLKEIL